VESSLNLLVSVGGTLSFRCGQLLIEGAESETPLLLLWRIFDLNKRNLAVELLLHLLLGVFYIFRILPGHMLTLAGVALEILELFHSIFTYRLFNWSKEGRRRISETQISSELGSEGVHVLILGVQVVVH
jgi:hypothetical protein